MSRDPIVEELKKYGSCDVSDALLSLSQPYGGFLDGITLWSPKRQEGPTTIAGPVYTVKYVYKNGSSNHWPQYHFIDYVPPDSILFISAPPDVSNAVCGGLLSTRAKFLGAAGIVVDGRIRDLQEHRDLEFPVFARDVGTTSPSSLLQVQGINVPFEIPGHPVTINPDDYLIGDLNGVVHIPKALAEKCLALIPSRIAADEMIAEDLKRGRNFEVASKERRANVVKAKDL